MRIALVLILVPLAELWLLWQLAQWTGFWTTVAIVVVTGFFGAEMLRRQGARAWRRFQTALAEGRLPTDEALHGLCILLGGILLITPGVITDLTGLALMIPGNRRGLVRRAKAWFQARLDDGTAQFHFFARGTPPEER